MKEFAKRLNALTAVMLLALSFLFVSCSDDDDDDTPVMSESEILLDYLEANGDFINTAAPAMIAAADVKTAITASPDKNLVIDIRSAADYANLGHIKGAVNKTIPQLYDYFKTGIVPANYDKIILACYTGQSASYSTSLLRLLGYNNVYAMKFGMSAWHDTCATTYKNTIGNGKAAMFVSTETPKPAKGTTYPTLTTGKTTGKEILEERVKALFALGYSSSLSNADACAITINDLYADLTKYHICNYWPAAEYLDPGHVAGAMNYLPKASLKKAADLLTLPTDKEVVIYCYTGQTSAHVAAFLRVLGYKAKTLQFGASGMIYDRMIEKNMTAFKPASDIKNYELVKD